MKNHAVEISDFEGFETTNTMCGSAGHGKQKRLDVITDPVKQRVWYELIVDHTGVYNGADLVEALQMYNDA